MNVGIDHGASRLLGLRATGAMDKLTNPTQGAGKRSPAGEPNKAPAGQSGFRHFVIPHVNGPEEPWELIEKQPSTLPERSAQSSQSIRTRPRRPPLCYTMPDILQM